MTTSMVEVVVSELIIGIRNQMRIKSMGTRMMQKHPKLDLILVGTATISNSPAPAPTNLYDVSAW
jgi:hypothetical protein